MTHPVKHKPPFQLTAHLLEKIQDFNSIAEPDEKRIEGKFTIQDAS